MKILNLLFVYLMFLPSVAIPQNVLKCDETGTFSEGMLSFRRGDAWGFADSTGKEVIPPAYFYSFGAPFFSDGLAVVQLSKGGKFGAIDKTGKLVVQPEFFTLMRFGSGVAVAFKPADAKIPGSRAHCKIVSKTGEIINDSTISDHGFETWYTEGLSVFRNSGKYGFLETKGEVVIPAIYKDARPFRNGMAAVNTPSGWKFIEKSGKPLEGFSSNVEPGVFSGDVATFTDANGKKGAIDKTGKVVISPVYEQLATFENGFSAGKYTDQSTWENIFEIVTSTGKVVKKFSPTLDKGKYYEIRSGFGDGLAVIIEGFSNYGFVDTKGNIKINTTFSEVSKFVSGRAYAKKKDEKTGIAKEGFIDRTGKFVFYIQN